MSHAKQVSKRKRRTKAVAALGVAVVANGRCIRRKR